MVIHWDAPILCIVLSRCQLAPIYSIRLEYLQESCWYKDECGNDVSFPLTSAAEEGILVKHDHVKRTRVSRESSVDFSFTFTRQ